LLSFDGWPASSGVAPPDRARPGPRPPNECASCHPMGPWASPVPGLDPSESSGAQFLDYYHQAFQFSKKKHQAFHSKKKENKTLHLLAASPVICETRSWCTTAQSGLHFFSVQGDLIGVVDVFFRLEVQILHAHTKSRKRNNLNPRYKSLVSRNFAARYIF